MSKAAATIEQVIQDIKGRIGITDLVGESVTLKRSGSGKWKGLCPFHNDHHPSLYVYEESGKFICFTCDEKGDIFDWYQKVHQADFSEALTTLAQQAGVDVPNQELSDPRVQQARTALDEQHQYYQMALRSAEGLACRRYIVKERGITKETAIAFGLGYAPQQRDDPFRGRMIVPLHDELGRLVGFSGRALQPNQKPKYLNSPQSELFQKGSLLYNLHRAKPAVRKSGVLLLMEGYTDVMLATQYGFPNCVATMGTALTETQVTMLARTKAKLVLCLDSDAAGYTATKRGIMRLNQIGGIVPSLYIVTLPAGEDPGDAVCRDVADFGRRIDQAQPVISWLVSTLAQMEFPDARSRAAAVYEVAPLVRNVPDPIEQDFYCQEIAQAVGSSAEAVRQAILRRGPRPVPATPALITTPPSQPQDTERILLGLCLTRPQWSKKFLSELQGTTLANGDNDALLRDVCKCLEQGETPLLALSVTPERTEVLDRLVEYVARSQYAPSDLEPEWTKTMHDVLRSLGHRSAKQRHAFLASALVAAATAGDKEKMREILEELRLVNEQLKPAPSAVFPDTRTPSK